MRNDYAFDRAISLNRFYIKHRTLIQGSTRLGIDHLRIINLETSQFTPGLQTPRPVEQQELNISTNLLQSAAASINLDPAERFVDENFDYCPLLDNSDVFEIGDSNDVVQHSGYPFDADCVSESCQQKYYVIGFSNPNNMCWLNSSLHALFTLPLLMTLKELFPFAESASPIRTFIELWEAWRTSSPEIQTKIL